ncbi:hypothetical protein ABG808_09675 [Streptococcus iniae]
MGSDHVFSDDTVVNAQSSDMSTVNSDSVPMTSTNTTSTSQDISYTINYTDSSSGQIIYSEVQTYTLKSGETVDTALVTVSADLDSHQELSNYQLVDTNQSSITATLSSVNKVYNFTVEAQSTLYTAPVTKSTLNIQSAAITTATPDFHDANNRYQNITTTVHPDFVLNGYIQADGTVKWIATYSYTSTSTATYPGINIRMDGMDLVGSVTWNGVAMNDITSNVITTLSTYTDYTQSKLYSSLTSTPYAESLFFSNSVSTVPNTVYTIEFTTKLEAGFTYDTFRMRTTASLSTQANNTYYAQYDYNTSGAKPYSAYMSPYTASNQQEVVNIDKLDKTSDFTSNSTSRSTSTSISASQSLSTSVSQSASTSKSTSLSTSQSVLNV